MLLEFFVWWYGSGWFDNLKRIFGRVGAIWRMFSVNILLKTMFAPWRRIVSPPGRSVEEIFRGMIDNLVSRTIGFFVRLVVVCIATVLTLVSATLAFCFALIWPLLPIWFGYCLLKGTIL